jgi:oxygen-independent coproporphyrinogen-3 oxidase
MAGIYFHIPFCKNRCIYCDFFSSTSLKEKKKYVEAMCEELHYRRDYLQGQEIRTIYFGGGTPSQLAAKDFEKIFQTLDACYGNDYAPSLEITLEANPDDLTPEYLQSIRHLPFNRISLGIQSFNERELKWLNRRHDALSAIHTVDRLQEAGFNNISIDLMYGLPEQTTATWAETLKQAINLDIQHISAYHLIYEKGTKLFNFLEQGSIKPLEEETSVQLFEMLIDALTEAGFEHYEISNFAKPAYRSKHNSSYWNGTHYLGIGAAAHSYNGVQRHWNTKTLNSNYMQYWEAETIDKKTAYNDFIITRLRTVDGMDTDELSRLFGEEKKSYCLQQAQKYISLEMLKLTGNRLQLTRKGIFVSDGIMSDLL